MTVRALLLCCSMLHLAFGQENQLQGVVVDTENVPIQYATIGVKGTSIGTITDSLGQFNLFVDSRNPNDSLIIRHIGFESKKFTLGEVMDRARIEIVLANDSKAIEEVVVTSYSGTLEEQGKNKTNTKYYTNFGISSRKNQNLGAIIGKKFKFSSKSTFRIDQIKFFVTKNDFSTVKFRLNVYEIKNGMPNDIINPQPIYVQLGDKQKGWVDVFIEDQDILVHDDVIIGIEWVEHSQDGSNLKLPIIIPSMGSTHYYRFGSESEWKKYSSMSIPMMVFYQKLE